MSEVTDAIDQIIVDCSKRDLVPSAEIVDDLLDLRSLIASTDRPVSVPNEETMTHA